MQGRFIVLDGGEGCGKSTQVRMLRDRLLAEGRSVLTVRDPGTTRIGERIRAILLDPDHREMGMRCEMLLYMSARAQLMHEVVLPALGDGQDVISDRFVSSTLAYQLGGDGLTSAQILQVAQVAVRDRMPDLVIILDMPVESSMKRVNPKFISLFPDADPPEPSKDRIELRPTEYHQRVRENYLAQARENPSIYRIVDADRDASSVHEQIWKHVAAL